MEIYGLYIHRRYTWHQKHTYITELNLKMQTKSSGKILKLFLNQHLLFQLQYIMHLKTCRIGKNLFQNGNDPKGSFTQLSIAKRLNVPIEYVMSDDEKGEMRDLILDNDKWSKSEWNKLKQTDVCD